MKQSFDDHSEKLERYLRALVETYTLRAESTARNNFLAIGCVYLLIFGLGILLFFSLTVWNSAMMTALSLSALLIALFGGYIFHRYFALQKPSQFSRLALEFMRACADSTPYPAGTPSYHTTLATANALLAEQLQDREYQLLPAKWLPKPLMPLTESISALISWRDLFTLKEILLKNSIEECLQLVRSDPVHLTYHSQLANAYVLLSRLYRTPSLDENRDEKRWVSGERYGKKMEEKYRLATEKAIEEFKIISSYAPEDPWVLSQLVVSYRDLGLIFEEIHACEELLRLCPTESETLHRLGTLYFKLGANAKGLEVYRQLCHIDCTLAGNLISHYGNN